MGELKRKEAPAKAPKASMKVGKISYFFHHQHLGWHQLFEQNDELWKQDGSERDEDAEPPYNEAEGWYDYDSIHPDIIDQLDHLRLRFAKRVEQALRRRFPSAEIVVAEESEAVHGEETMGCLQVEPEGAWLDVAEWAEERAVIAFVAEHEEEWLEGAWDDWARRERGGRLYT